MRFTTAALGFLVLTACGEDRGASATRDAGASAARDAGASAARDPAPEASHESGWVAIEGVQFPALFAETPPEIVEAYVFAARHPEVLRYLPCYCGCERESPPHRSNYDCFVDAIDRTGPLPRVSPDPMGFT